MGAYHCKYCGCPEKYYSSREHASRPSCWLSEDNRHKFKYYLNHDLYYCSKNLIESLYTKIHNNFTLLSSDSRINPS